VHTKVLAPQGFTFCVHKCIQGKGEENIRGGLATWPSVPLTTRYRFRTGLTVNLSDA
jgi:hypothetical protein